MSEQPTYVEAMKQARSDEGIDRDTYLRVMAKRDQDQKRELSRLHKKVQEMTTERAALIAQIEHYQRVHCVANDRAESHEDEAERLRQERAQLIALAKRAANLIDETALRSSQLKTYEVVLAEIEAIK